MKKILLTISLAVLANSLLLSAPIVAYRPDPEVPQEIKEGTIKNLPDKAFVAPKKTRKVLVFSRTTSVRHYLGITSTKFFIEELAKKTGAFEPVFNDDLENFEAENLKKFDCVIMNNTTGRVFAELPTKLEKMGESERNAIFARDEKLRQNLLDYVKNGGGLFTIHAGADTYRAPNERWEPYLEMVGGDFIKHPWSKGAVVVCEDKESPITKGIWPEYGVYIGDEIYMYGPLYDRGKVRVLLSVEVDRSPVSSPVREDKDCALIWIKNYGKGRVANGAFGHSGKTYVAGPQIPATYLRLIQFVCGDLDADTTPIKKPALAIAPKASPKPTMEDVKAFRTLEYGDEVQGLSSLIFAFYAYNELDDFRSEMEMPLLDELSSGNGSERYRALLCQVVDAVGANDAKAFAKLNAIIAAEKDAAVKTRLENARIRFEDSAAIKLSASAYDIPDEIPAEENAAFNAIVFYKVNKTAPMKSWMTFENMRSSRLKTALIYTLAERKEGMAQIKKITPENANEIVACSFAIAQMGSFDDLENIARYANALDKETYPAFVQNLSLVLDGQKLARLMTMFESQDALKSKLAADILCNFNVASEKGRLLEIFGTTKSEHVKMGCITVLGGMSDNEIFNALLGYMLTESGQVKIEICKLLMRMSLDGLNAEDFGNVVKTYEKAVSDSDKKFLIRFAPAASNNAALEFCQKAVADGYKEEVLKFLPRWKNDSAKSLQEELSK